VGGAGQGAEQRGLARAVGPDQADHVTRADGEARIGHQEAGADLDGEVSRAEHDGSFLGSWGSRSG
jgi:hypothetical protein